MFWFNGWTVYLMKGVSNMALKKYIGLRYAPKFVGAWDKTSEYAALSVVYTNEQSYVSRKTVPANTEITNTEFWIKSADWNAQVAQYNQNVEQYQANVEKYNQNVETYTQAVDQFYADTLHSYDTKSDMVADRSLKLGDTLLTCGNAAIGDGGGSFYQVVPETSAKAVALENGLFALPFEFQPYDYSEFQGEVDRVVESFGTSVAEIKAASLGTYDNVAKMKADTTLKANTTVLTTGEATVGDNKGSFYRVQDTSDRTDAVPLDNGKKAVPFALDVGAVAGTALTFNGRSDAAAVWNVKAPGAVTIPLSVPAGGTATVFLGVLYGANESTVTATLNINSGNVKTMTFTDKGDATHDKICVYAITVKYDGSAYSWGSATSASWLVDYQRDKVTLEVAIPNGAPVLGVEQTNKDMNLAFTVSKKINITGIKTNFNITGEIKSGILNIGESTLQALPSTKTLPATGEAVTTGFSVTVEPGKTYILGVAGILWKKITDPFLGELTVIDKKYGAPTAVPAGDYGVFNIKAPGIYGNFTTDNLISCVLIYDE